MLQIDSVVKKYGDYLALNQVSIHIPENSIFGLLGPNGAGKTTLIRIINQITAPDSGQILLQGQKLNPSHTSLIGYLPEERGLYKKMKVGEQALYLAQLKGLSAAEAKKRLRYWFTRFGIESWWGRKVEELSKGMQQKVQFIVTVIHQPPLLIFDEPFSGFDPINVNLLKDEILELHRQGATIIFSTHNMASVEELCDNIALINHAETILQGNVKQIRKSHSSRTYRVQYMGEPLQQGLIHEFEICGSAANDEYQESLIKLPQNKTANDLLHLLIDKVSIVGFHEQIPSMNEIFISTVNQVNQSSELSE